MKHLSGRFCGIAIALMVIGCVPIPVSVPEEKPFKDLLEESIVVGTTTSAELVEQLGNPEVLEDGDWLYRDSRDGWGWLLIGGIPGHGADAVPVPRGGEDYFLIIEMSADNVVAGARVYSENELCAEKHVCYEDDSLMLEAPKEEDVAAKLFHAPGAGCSVYAYSTTNSDTAAGDLSVDGRSIGGLVGTSGYYLQVVSTGPHTWVVIPTLRKALPDPIAYARIDCKNQEIIFLRYSRGMAPNTIEVVDAERGKKDILKRWLAVALTEDGEQRHDNWLRSEEIYVTKKGNTNGVYEIVDPEKSSGRSKLVKWGATSSGEPCGMRAALEEYGLSPMGGVDPGLQFGRSLRSRVQVRAICNVESVCTFASVYDGQSCEAKDDTEIEFATGSDLLLLEPHGDSYNEVYYGKVKALQKHAACKSGVCSIDVARLRNILSDTGSTAALE